MGGVPNIDEGGDMVHILKYEEMGRYKGRGIGLEMVAEGTTTFTNYGGSH